MMKSKDIAYCGTLAALALIFGYIESLFPLPVAIPGIKLGLSNIVVLFSLYKFGKLRSFFIMLIKVFASALLFSGMSGLIYSAAGAVFSFFVMCILKKCRLSVIGVSIGGGIFHNIGQIAAAAFVLSSSAAFYYLPVLIISGIVVGSLTGIVCNIVLLRMKMQD